MVQVAPVPEVVALILPHPVPEAAVHPDLTVVEAQVAVQAQVRDLPAAILQEEEAVAVHPAVAGEVVRQVVAEDK